MISWYSQQLLVERRSDAPDPHRLEELKERQRACREDRSTLEDAGPTELARITTTYEALLDNLESTE
ncbi:hypothetical protein ACIOUE_35620 [Streptomyces xanthochromogenes]|uniref:hypothetical protein n=1 Tax=Streptomyces xanthochromogenes TaxID=67384 RepID=UPI003805CCA5